MKSLCNLAIKAKERGRHPLQLRLAEWAVDLSRHDLVAKSQYADALLCVGRTEEALAAYEDVIRGFPAEAVPRCGRADVLLRLGRLPEALTAYDEVARQFPHDVVPRNGRADVLRRLGRYEEALALLPAAGMQGESDWIGFHIRGMTYLGQGKLAEAAGVFERGMRDCSFPMQVPYFATALAVTRLRQREWKQAAQAIEGRTDEVAQVLRLHIQGEQEQFGLAVQTYLALEGTTRLPIRELRDTLAARFLNQAARSRPAPPEWTEAVLRQECELVSPLAA